MTRIGAGLWGQFQFTPLREGRRGASGKTAAGCYFNSRPSARGDCPRANCKIANRAFQFTPIREGRPPPEQMEASPAAFQFTPLREGRHVRLWERTICTGISIHAPPRGATTQVDTIDGYVLFQFTPLREGRLVPFPRIKSFILFQFTPLREGRPRLSSVLVASRYISIHAPPRGATMLGFPDSPAILFQFTPLREGRHEDEADQHRRGISIHAPPRGATRALTRRTTSPSYFNSRPSARGDTRSATRWHRRILFQFTPLREGRHTQQQS